MKNIVAVVVTYNPNSNINKLINSLENQVGTIIVVDNGSSQKDFLIDNLSPSLEVIELPTNLGKVRFNQS
ncbi:glycosyltransferase [Enterobacter hormaechei]|uniref:glycosyltransferase n=1 Tax=Enterobacter hormaechei TaxID=158836 RepID=UPI0039FC1D94